MRAIPLVAAIAVALSGHANAAAPSCTSPADPFLNPFSKDSAHHRPIGQGAQYATADHPSSVSWRGARSININAGAPWGVSVAETDATDPLVTIGAVGLKCGNVVGFPKPYDCQEAASSHRSR